MGIAVIAAGLAACNNSTDSEGGTPTPATAPFRTVNAIDDSVTVSTSITDSVQTDTQTLGFGAAGTLAFFPPGGYTAEVLPSNATQQFPQIPINNVVLSAESITTIISAGVLANSTQIGFIAQESLTPSPASGQFVVQAANAASAVSQGRTLAFNFISPPGSTSGTPTQISPVAFAQAGSPIDLPAGKYEIVVYSNPTCATGTACPDNVELVFDSGPNGISLPAATGADFLQIVAIDATSTQSNSGNGSPITLLLLDNTGVNTQLLNLQN